MALAVERVEMNDQHWQRRLDRTLGAAQHPLRKYLMDKVFFFSFCKNPPILFLYFSLDSRIDLPPKSFSEELLA